MSLLLWKIKIGRMDTTDYVVAAKTLDKAIDLAVAKHVKNHPTYDREDCFSAVRLDAQIDIIEGLEE
jgi:hypothetical protein